MFNEREALRLRLEQLNEAEVKVIREYQIERDNIYAKLRELDRPSSFNDTKKDFRPERKSESLPVLAELAAQEMKSYQQQPQASQKNQQQTSQQASALPAGIPDGTTRRRRGTARPGSKAAKLREAAIKTLKRHNAAIKSSELQKEIEKESGLEIPNMTTFMQSLIKMYPEVKKPYRGQYILEGEISTETEQQ
ncbi:transcriptional regulator Rok [Bacillus swezeyi]|uniref:Repressor n=1 Tax=Bacillus swezeyi TaxID=1925020 RepID=A0A1R1RRM7_9BACI|nr:transcriptional regulator Rok [Bacillus swezeyi]MEC1262316.1 transcriptional regulator Rok [Bacillus swezeyi]MED2926975.1 transcriptional regulator Rok [Bacillus swezeyi]MED2943246.1 transcriptional regulator Rok [Bacillus swezeyi]MED2965463.1 transcriptional regulator Rok [Bacillus swezeyi]MED3071134.1 transcriptional regulator Rok [Bacillus swezeyi]